MSQYCHLLIPNHAAFIPYGEQVIEYLQSLEKLGAAPQNPAIVFSKPTGEMISRIHPVTKATIERKVWGPVSIQKLTDLAELITGLNEYSIYYKGRGPMPLPGFSFREPFEGEYDVNLILKVVPEPVSMSDYLPPQFFEFGSNDAGGDSAFEEFAQANPHIISFGKSCGPECLDAYYNHPETLDQIKVAGAGRARFWITFEYGKRLFPKIDNTLDVMESRIVEQTQKSFGITFLQGCNVDIG
jgi:hypothetical protein